MEMPDEEPVAVVEENVPSSLSNGDYDNTEEQQLDQIEAEIVATNKRNTFISNLKDTTDLQELIQRAKALARAGITTADEVLTASRTDVCTKGRITEEIYQSLLQHASMPFMPQMFAASEWREQQSARLSFGSPEIDAFLRGGLRPFGITEVAGEAGAGKSQICMQLCANVQLPISLGGLGGAALYISTEGAFPQRRFSQIVSALKQRYAEMAEHDFLSRVVVEQAPTAQRVLDILTVNARHIIARLDVRLLVLDSIAAVFREYGSDEMIERAKLMWRIAQQLKYLADGAGGRRVMVLVTNQVSNKIDGPEASLTGNSRTVPALGLAWAVSVNTRLLVRRTALRTAGDIAAATVGTKRHAEEQLAEDPAVARNTGIHIRELSVGFAPHLGDAHHNLDAHCFFTVDRAGIISVPQSDADS